MLLQLSRCRDRLTLASGGAAPENHNKLTLVNFADGDVGRSLGKAIGVVMGTNSKSKINPYIVGQVTLLLGGIALGLAILPRAIIENEPAPSVTLNGASDDVAIQQQLKPFRVTSMAVAIVGLCLGPIGWIRERPPLLPVSGMSMCAVALLWSWIVLGVMLAVGLFVLFVILAMWGGVF